MARVRADQLLVNRGLASSREEAKRFILAGMVWSKEVRLDKAGSFVSDEIPVLVKGGSPFVSRGGEKLEAALAHFQVSVENRVCIDVGASTGGFTDCLLQRGARHVFAIDVGYGQISSKLRGDSRVTVIERCNARYLTSQDIGAVLHPTIGVMDVSFISALKVLLPISEAVLSIEEWVLLFKPQFEVGRSAVGKNGLVRDQDAVERALMEFRHHIEQNGFRLKGAPLESPVQGKKSGNQEYLLHLVRDRESSGLMHPQRPN